jgi:hypothetical protein
MRRGLWIVKFMVFGVLALVLIGLVTQTLWNWLVPVLFTGPVITFWQALGLLLLSKILFWSFGKGGGHWSNKRGGHWGYYWSEKWKNMTPEDREKFKQKMKDKWCYPEQAEVKRNSDISNG